MKYTFLWITITLKRYHQKMTIINEILLYFLIIISNYMLISYNIDGTLLYLKLLSSTVLIQIRSQEIFNFFDLNMKYFMWLKYSRLSYSLSLKIFYNDINSKKKNYFWNNKITLWLRKLTEIMTDMSYFSFMFLNIWKFACWNIQAYDHNSFMKYALTLSIVTSHPNQPYVQ